MSLVVWLPLNGSLENQGLSNVTVTNNGATVDDNGKIGKCYSFNGTNSRISVNLSNNLLTNQYSISCWVYIKAFSPDSDCRYIMTIGNASGSADQMIGFYLNKNNTITLNSESSIINTGTLSLNIWYHLVGTYDGTVLTFYLNGIKVNSIPKSKPANKINLSIGSRSNATNNTTGAYYSTCKLNDVRVYDHCLSAKEVKELAKGLVLHYRLAGPGQENLVTTMTAGGRTTLVDKYTLNANFGQNADTYGYINVKPALELDKIYTLSFDVLNMPTGSRWNWQLWNNANYSFWVDGNGHHSYTFCPSIAKLPNDYNLTKFLFDDGSRTNPAGIVTFTNFKIEEGSIATPWCPHKDDPLYISLGYNNNIEYDCSGYRRNGTKSGTITWDIDSPRYTTSYHFSNSQSINYTENLTFLTTGSISFWARFNTKGSSGWLPFTGQNGRYYVMATSGGTGNFYNDNVAAVGTIKYYEDSKAVSAPKNDGKWHHYVITGINISAWTIFKINNYSPEWNSDVNYSDIRVYNTVLSEEDIAELYHSAVIVDNTGKNYAYEYFEA